MKPPAFEYRVAQTQGDVLALLAEHGDRAKLLAGGQSLIPLMNFRLAQPELLIDINQVAELSYVREWDGGVAIGALTRQSALERSDTVAARLPILVEATGLVGHLPIRHRGTLGGNLAHADPASELPAVMLALGADFAVAGPHGSRTVPAAQFFTDALTTALHPDELLVEVRAPGLPPRTGGAFVEVARRHGDYALAGAAALVTLNAAGRCERVRLALCGVAPTALRVAEAEQALLGEVPAGAALDAAADRAAAAADPPGDVHASAAFRRKLARVVARQAIELAARRAGGA
jgi:aerobic carbon-monoxide dehydrogenase medium subunit